MIIRHDVTAVISNPGCDPIHHRVGLIYNPADPWAVAIDFSTPTDVNVWRFAREILDEGCRTHAGWGDVRVWPHRGICLALALTSPEGPALVKLRLPEVRRFLGESYVEVPPGTETVDVDAFLAKLPEVAGGA